MPEGQFTPMLAISFCIDLIVEQIALTRGAKKKAFEGLLTRIREFEWYFDLHAKMGRHDLISLILAIFIGGPVNSISDRVNKFLNLKDSYSIFKNLGEYLSKNSELVKRVELVVDPIIVAKILTNGGWYVFGDDAWDKINDQVYHRAVIFDDRLIKLIDDIR